MPDWPAVSIWEINGNANPKARVKKEKPWYFTKFLKSLNFGCFHQHEVFANKLGRENLGTLPWVPSFK